MRRNLRVTGINELRAQVAKALAHPLRLKIIDAISDGEEKCVCDLVAELGWDQPIISKHLSIMKNAGILASRREGTRTLYSIRTPCVKKFLACIDEILKYDRKEKEQELSELLASSNF